MKVILETDRLLLREYVEEDAEAFFKLNHRSGSITIRSGTRPYLTSILKVRHRLLSLSNGWWLADRVKLVVTADF